MTCYSYISQELERQPAVEQRRACASEELAGVHGRREWKGQLYGGRLAASYEQVGREVSEHTHERCQPPWHEPIQRED